MNEPTCAHCSSADHLEPCQSCHRAICPRHRFGFGSLEDGYFCTPGCKPGLMQTVFPETAKPMERLLQERILKRVFWEVLLIAIATLAMILLAKSFAATVRP